MATMAALAIREEKARERIAKATEQLSLQLGKPVPQLGRGKPKDPKARGAQLSEDIADVLESLLDVVVTVNEEHLAVLESLNAGTDTDTDDDAPDDDTDNKGEVDGDDNTGTGSGDPAQPIKEPIKRSATKRKR